MQTRLEAYPVIVERGLVESHLEEALESLGWVVCGEVSVQAFHSADQAQQWAMHWMEVELGHHSQASKREHWVVEEDSGYSNCSVERRGAR